MIFFLYRDFGFFCLLEMNEKVVVKKAVNVMNPNGEGALVPLMIP